MKNQVQKGETMRFKVMLVAAFVLAGTLAGTSASTKATSKQSQSPKCYRCSPAFPGSIPHCASGGGSSGGGAGGSGGAGTGDG